MYMITCIGCNQPHHRKAFRKKGGGVHNMCPVCRRRELAKERRLLYRIKAAVETAKHKQMLIDIEKRKARLIHEFNAATTQNRARIKALSANPKPTKATVKWLERRIEVQALWENTLKQLLLEVEANPYTTKSLRVAMHQSTSGKSPESERTDTDC